MVYIINVVQNVHINEEFDEFIFDLFVLLFAYILVLNKLHNYSILTFDLIYTHKLIYNIINIYNQSKLFNKVNLIIINT